MTPSPTSASPATVDSASDQQISLPAGSVSREAGHDTASDRPTVEALARTYDRYHGTGFYARRYPAPNPRCLNHLLGLINDPAVVTDTPDILDFGCGDGRYAAPLLEMSSARLTAYDISDVALVELRQRCSPHIAMGRLQTIGGDLDHLEQTVGDDRFDLIVLMFGVLGHIPGRANRIDVLSRLARLLKPSGRIVVTVPNAARRFGPEQKNCQDLVRSGRLEPGDILYSRHSDGQTFDLYYHLYRAGELEREMTDAGLVPRRSMAESIFPESGVVHSRWLQGLDRVLAAILPRQLAYGFMVEAGLPVGNGRG